MRHRVVDDWLLAFPESRRERRRGLLGRSHLDPLSALILQRCRSVHSIGMRMSIDVVLFDREWRPLGVVGLVPGRALFPRRDVRHVVEVAAGRGMAFSEARVARTIPDTFGSGRQRRR